MRDIPRFHIGRHVLRSFRLSIIVALVGRGATPKATAYNIGFPPGDTCNGQISILFFSTSAAPIKRGIRRRNDPTCRVKFPGLEDIEPVIDTPGNVGLAAGYANISKLIKAQCNVDRDRSELIGVRERNS
jgi:hypothetical protein